MEDKKPEDGALSLGFLAEDISFVTRVLRSKLARENAAFIRRHEVASGEVAILSLIGLNPGVSQKDLAGAVVLKKSALTKAVNTMEASGLIERRKGSGDQRFNTLHLTPAGEAKWQAMRKDMFQLQNRLLEQLSNQERQELFGLLWRLVGEPRKVG
jgi:DNA-binding MarR family transcriptional regulator